MLIWFYLLHFSMEPVETTVDVDWQYYANIFEAQCIRLQEELDEIKREDSKWKNTNNEDCYKCSECKNCKMCVNCTGCRNCYGCINCFQCIDCKGTLDSKQCRMCDRCRRCSKVENCDNCTDLHGCSWKAFQTGKD